MVEKSVKLSSKDSTPVEITRQVLSSRSLASRNRQVCSKRGVFTSQKPDGDLAEDLSDISDAEVAGYLNNNNNFLLKKIAWEMMNPDYQKGKPKKSVAKKKKEPVTRIPPSKKTTATKTESNAESENKKRASPEINYDVLDKLFNDEPSTKRAKFEKPGNVDYQMKYSQQSNEGYLLKPQGSEEEEPDWNEDYSNEDAYGGVEEFCGDADPELEEYGEEEDNEDIIW